MEDAAVGRAGAAHLTYRVLVEYSHPSSSAAVSADASPPCEGTGIADRDSTIETARTRWEKPVSRRLCPCHGESCHDTRAATALPKAKGSFGLLIGGTYNILADHLGITVVLDSPANGHRRPTGSGIPISGGFGGKEVKGRDTMSAALALSDPGGAPKSERLRLLALDAHRQIPEDPWAPVRYAKSTKTTLGGVADNA
ncbi:hypothetical protein CMUS01_04103 [Colletotrichum musicola]|uniref:Uncharacterized protein n=1 Tax=Colletotrichum musicola TaxID=2175873 RepID=A0A8H6U4K7_9PEZI|nr:hypothetical protein CMUS01_04103 [Colletotrichum musicola]